MAPRSFASFEDSSQPNTNKKITSSGPYSKLNNLGSYKDTFFKGKIDTNRVALIGHSMGGNSLLSLANRAFGTFHPGEVTLLPQDDARKTKECIFFTDGESTYPRQIKHPILFCLSQERKSYQEQSGTLEDLKRIGSRSYNRGIIPKA